MLRPARGLAVHLVRCSTSRRAGIESLRNHFARPSRSTLPQFPDFSERHTHSGTAFRGYAEPRHSRLPRLSCTSAPHPSHWPRLHISPNRDVQDALPLRRDRPRPLALAILPPGQYRVRIPRPAVATRQVPSLLRDSRFVPPFPTMSPPNRGLSRCLRRPNRAFPIGPEKPQLHERQLSRTM